PVDPSEEIDGQLQLARLRLTYGEGSPEPVTFRDWNIERKLGRGGMGAVYLATHRTLGRKVALKILAGDPHRDLVREARALAASPDPRVIQIFSVDDSAPPTIIIEMEYVDGQNLRAWRSDTNPSWRTVTEIFVAVAEGLAAIHRAGLVHRDIKPDNVLIARDRTTIKIVDFGLAVVPRTATLTPQSPPPTTASLALRFTAEGALVGTHGYIAPEVHGGDDATPKSDQFAFASAFFEALFGALPFEGASPAKQAEALRHGTFTVAIDGHLPAWLAATLRRALAFDPAKRFASMDDLAAHLRRGLARRRRALLGLGVLTILATGASFSWALKPPQEDPCARAGEPMQALWPAANRPALVTTDEAPGPTASARDLLVRTVDRRSATWIDARIRHCAAERRAPLLDLEARALNRRQRACLDQSRSDLGALLGALRHAPQT
ncbi:MAG TPA: serine/threonine-protein kinase, partial [Nannocystaceae bacterium]|nr:serine/threonine-protein kinase [Nannocystaceae bacterium]